jgi:O-antigen ligase
MSESGAATFSTVVRERGFVRARAVQKDKWAFVFVWLFTVAVYARPEDIGPQLAPLHLTLVLGCCAVIAYLKDLISGSRVIWTRELGVVLMLTAWFVLGLPFALWPGGSLRILTDVWLKTVVIFYLLTQTLVTLSRIRLLLWAIILSELVVTGVSILGSSNVIWIGGRMSGVSLGFLGWNFLGIAAAVTIPYISALFVVARSPGKILLLVAASAGMLWMLVLTASRSGLLAVMFSVALSLILVLRTGVRGRVAGAVITGVLFTAIALAPKVLWERMGTMWDSSSVYGDQIAASAEVSKEDHIAVLKRSIQYTLEHPLFGLGLGNFEVASGTQLRQSEAWVGTHNTFTEISSEAGIPALGMFLALLSLAVRNVRRVARICTPRLEDFELGLMARAAQASLLAFAFGAIFAHLAYEYYFFYLVALAAGIQYVSRSTSPESGSAGDALVARRVRASRAERAL